MTGLAFPVILWSSCVPQPLPLDSSLARFFRARIQRPSVSQGFSARTALPSPPECWFFFFINLLLLIIIIGAGGVAQQLRVYTPLVEDLNFIPSTQVGSIKTTQLQGI